MKQFITVCASLLVSGTGFMAMAQDYPQGFKVLEPSGEYVSSVSYIKMAWEYNETTGEGTNLNLVSRTKNLTLTYNGTEYKFNFNTAKTPTIENDNVLQIDLTKISGLTPGAGEYKVTIPANYVTLGSGDINEAVNFTFTVMGSMQGSPEVTPAAGEYTTTALAGATVKLVYSDYKSVAINTTSDPITVVYAQDGQEGSTETITSAQVSGNELTFNLSSNITDKSSVTVTVPQNYLLATDEDGQTFIGGGTTIAYTVWNGLPNAEVLECPPLDTPFATPVKLTWGVPVELVGNSLPLTFHGWDSTTKDNFSIEVYPGVSYEENNTVMVLNLDPIIEYATTNNMKPSCYYFDIAEGVVKEVGSNRVNKGKMNLFYFQIQDYCPLVPQTTLSGDSFTMKIDSDLYVLTGVNNNVAVTQNAYFVNTITNGIINAFFSDFKYVEGSGGAISIDLSQYDFDGGYENYTLHLPFGYFKINDYSIDPNMYSTVYSLAWDLPLKSAAGYVGEEPKAPEGGTSLVESIETSIDAPVEYYNLSGIRIAQPAKGQVVIRRQGDKVSKIMVR